MIRPIRPDEVPEHKSTVIPEAVFKVFNDLIALDYVDGQATVKQEDAVVRIAAELNIPRHEILNKGYLNIEEAYRAAGWKVEYDKPGYSETYEPFFVFSS